jgi:hypothetical protein
VRGRGVAVVPGAEGRSERNGGIGRDLVIEALRLAAGHCVDLLSEEGATANVANVA